jgi:hypothetical protein
MRNGHELESNAVIWPSPKALLLPHAVVQLRHMVKPKVSCVTSDSYGSKAALAKDHVRFWR